MNDDDRQYYPTPRGWAFGCEFPAPAVDPPDLDEPEPEHDPDGDADGTPRARVTT